MNLQGDEFSKEGTENSKRLKPLRRQLEIDQRYNFKLDKNVYSSCADGLIGTKE
tara:strand:- start:784 stop:945 length:162 start_codon:yes stop_codon:yes gene_type:complete